MCMLLTFCSRRCLRSLLDILLRDRLAVKMGMEMEMRMVLWLLRIRIVALCR
jgi:hypothetical protein